MRFFFFGAAGYAIVFLIEGKLETLRSRDELAITRQLLCVLEIREDLQTAFSLEDVLFLPAVRQVSEGK